MSRDDLFASGRTPSGAFEFNDAVAAVFPDMLERSIPGYGQTIEAIGLLARRAVQPDSNCYDLGCSLGAAALAIRHNVRANGCRIVAVDASAPMVQRCREIVSQDDGRVPVDVIEADLRDVAIENASLAVMNYTLQFLPPAERGDAVSRVAAGMRPGGVFVLSEKVVHDDARFESLLFDLHHDFKRRNAYSDLEIARKRAALENVLIPDTVETHTRRLQDAGFRTAGVWLRWFNFVSLLAVR